MPLALEHWPAHLRGIASGILQGGFSWGFMISSFAFQFLYPVFNATPGLGWRAMFWIGVLPALLVLWIRNGVSESPVWLERQKHLSESNKRDQVSVVRILKPDLIWVTLHTSLLMGAFIFSYHSTSFWYPTFLRESALRPFWYMVALNAGAILGSIAWGQVSETRLGRRGAASLGALMAIAMIPFYLFTTEPLLRVVGAFLMGVGGPGMWGVIPGYLVGALPHIGSRRRPGLLRTTRARRSVRSLRYMLGDLRDSGWALNSAMALFIGIANRSPSSCCGSVPRPAGAGSRDGRRQRRARGGACLEDHGDPRRSHVPVTRTYQNEEAPGRFTLDQGLRLAGGTEFVAWIRPRAGG